jgi:hypothetical protein
LNKTLPIQQLNPARQIVPTFVWFPRYLHGRRMSGKLLLNWRSHAEHGSKTNCTGSWPRHPNAMKEKPGPAKPWGSALVNRCQRSGCRCRNRKMGIAITITITTTKIWRDRFGFVSTITLLDIEWQLTAFRGASKGRHVYAFDQDLCIAFSTRFLFTPIPVPLSIWFLGSGIVRIIGLLRKSLSMHIRFTALPVVRKDAF